MASSLAGNSVEIHVKYGMDSMIEATLTLITWRIKYIVSLMWEVTDPGRVSPYSNFCRCIYSIGKCIYRSIKKVNNFTLILIVGLKYCRRDCFLAYELTEIWFHIWKLVSSMSPLSLIRFVKTWNDILLYKKRQEF